MQKSKQQRLVEAVMCVEIAEECIWKALSRIDDIPNLNHELLVRARDISEMQTQLRAMIEAEDKCSSL